VIESRIEAIKKNVTSTHNRHRRARQQMVLVRLAHHGQSLAVRYGCAMRGLRRMYHFKLGVIQDLEARGLLSQVTK
jgi:hypothetical protein